MKPAIRILSLAVAALSLQASLALAQTSNANTSSNSGGSGNEVGSPTDSPISTTNTELTNGGGFGSGLSNLANSSTRFQGGGNQLGGNTNSVANQSFNRLLQVQTLQQTNRLGRQFSTGRSARSMIRPTLRVGFTIPRRPASDLNQSLARRFDKLSTRLQRLSETRPAFVGVKFNVGENGAVVLTGEVASASARRLAANIVTMESGVRTVTNELTVATQ